MAEKSITAYDDLQFAPLGEESDTTSQYHGVVRELRGDSLLAEYECTGEFCRTGRCTGASAGRLCGLSRTARMGRRSLYLHSGYGITA